MKNESIKEEEKEFENDKNSNSKEQSKPKNIFDNVRNAFKKLPENFLNLFKSQEDIPKLNSINNNVTSQKNNYSNVIKKFREEYFIPNVTDELLIQSLEKANGDESKALEYLIEYMNN